jgi:hypothetical protein
MKYLVITNCTNRKSLKPELKLARMPTLKKGEDIGVSSREWISNVNSAKNNISAGMLYQGRSIQDIKITAEILKSADIYVISAGLGLVNFDEQVPSYELSVSDSAPFNKKLNSYNFPITHWWSSVNKARTGHSKPLSRLINTGHYTRIFIAASSAYLDLIMDDLWTASPTQLKKVVVFTSPFGQKKIPQKWHSQIAPYDERFEDKKSGYAGTRVDFPQRTLRHFVEALKLQTQPIESARDTVSKLIDQLNKPVLPERKKVTDEEVIRLIKKNWKSQLGISHKLLRHLRDINLVSCEQSRFKRLWHEVVKSKQQEYQ